MATIKIYFNIGCILLLQCVCSLLSFSSSIEW